MDLARVVTAPMEKAVRAMEKAAATGGAAEMEGKAGGRGGLEACWRSRKVGGHARA